MAPADLELDLRVRLAAFAFLEESVRRSGSEVLPAKLLWEGFEFMGQRVQLKGLQGIFKPAILPEIPLSITTAPAQPGRERLYDDGFSEDGATLLYRYRGTDPAHHENRGLRRAMELRRPLIYFHGVTRAEYFTTWPVFVTADEPERLRFHVAMDDVSYAGTRSSGAIADQHDEARRAYITVTTRHRLHQQSFRLRVLRAYRERCALCRLRYQELLDAAHIVPDSDPDGLPVVVNGVALCKLHHAAFDRNLIGIRPDLVVEVRPEVLVEQDGPMLVHGLQRFHGRTILVPTRADQRPRADLLEKRYAAFRESFA